MAVCNLIRRRRYHERIDALPKLAEKLRVLLLKFKRSYKIIFIKVLTESNVDISNVPNFSDVYRFARDPM